MSIRWKIAAVSLLLVFVPIYVLHRYAIGFFDQFTRTALERRMIDHAFVAGEDYRALVLRGPPQGEGAAAFAERLARYGLEFGTRLRIVGADGAVLFDSDPLRTPDPTPGPPEGARPEVRRALAGRYGARAALTPDRRFMYYYLALPVRDADRVAAAAYASRNTSPIIRAIGEMRGNQRRAIGLALGVAALLSLLLAATLTIRLRQLTRSAEAFARGDRAFDADGRGGDEIAVLVRAIRRMAEEIRRKNSYNRDFLADTMHELKTPLTAIRGATELLEAGAAAKPEARAKFLANIRIEADRLGGMVDQLAALTRLDAEEARGRKEQIDYAAAVRALVERLDSAWPSPRARLVLQVPPGPIPLRVLPGRIEQVIANLLENAFRYTPPDGEVELRVEPGPDRVTTLVRDTGRGIAPADLPKVFDRFFTTEPKGARRDYGSGLGLAIARSIVETHGGAIEAESPPGGGAVFRFTLPAGA